MAFTENYTILNDLPLFWDPRCAGRRLLLEHVPSATCRAGSPSIPRHGTTDDIRWFEADPTFVLHWTNAYEDGDEIVLDGFFQHNPTGAGRRTVRRRPQGLRDARHERAAGAERIAGGSTWSPARRPRSRSSDRCLEFPMVNGRHAGRRHRYSYNARCTHGLFAFDGAGQARPRHRCRRARRVRPTACSSARP